MKVTRFHVKGYRSLRDVDLNNLGGLNVLIGRNSSGKSNVLEAMNLFFSEFSATGGGTQGLDEYFWFRGLQPDPIQFEVTLELSNDEVSRVLQGGLAVGANEKPVGATGTVEISRRILNPQGGWKTDHVSLEGARLVNDDKITSPEQIGEASAVKAAPGAGVASATSQITSQVLADTLGRLTNIIKAGFKLVSVDRDGKNPGRFRTTLTDDAVQSRIWALDQSIASPDDERYSAYEDAFAGLTGLRLDPAQSRIMIKKGSKRFPLGLEGGGIQSSTNLLYGILIDGEPVSIFGLEEPENHFHPELQRKFAKQLREAARTKQFFVATHSPIFLSNDSNVKTLLTRLEGNETEIVETGNLAGVLREVGAKPSDLLFSDKVIFVEGKSDKVILEAYAQRLGIDLTGIELIPIRGKSHDSRALDTWKGIAKDVIPLFFILDGDAVTEVDSLVKGGKLEKGQVHLWRKGSIEDYYGTEVITDALTELNNSHPSLGLDVGKITKEIQSGKLAPDEIGTSQKKELLEKSWEVELAEQVAKLIGQGKGTIPEEIEETLIVATASSY